MSWLSRFSTLQIALAASLLVHAALLGVRVVNPEGFNRVFQDTPLEVILVNSRSAEAPPVAQAIAQANLTGGGEMERGRATSPLPPSPTWAAGNADDDVFKQREQLQEVQRQILAQLRRDSASLPAPDPTQDKGNPQAADQEEKRRRRVELIAEIERRINEENARPRKRFISPATREEVYAQYYDQLRRKIEDRGTRSFPTQQGRKIYGELTMNVTVDAAGRVVETEIVRPSKSKVLDRQAEAIVKAAGPFGVFSGSMRREADQLVITSRFRFSREEGMEAIPLGPETSSVSAAPSATPP